MDFLNTDKSLETVEEPVNTTMDFLNTDKYLETVEEPVNTTMDFLNTDKFLETVEEPVNTTMDFPNTDKFLETVEEPVNTTMDFPNTDKFLETVDQLLSNTMNVSNTDKTLQADTSKSSDDDGYVSDGTQDDSDVMFVGISVPEKPVAMIVGKAQHSRSYKYYLCRFYSELQVTFITHFTTKHPGQSFKCDFCDGLFQTCNGLFKHERSHQYMCYRCDLGGHRMQCPYQMKVHYKVHSCSDLLKCDLCD